MVIMNNFKVQVTAKIPTAKQGSVIVCGVSKTPKELALISADLNLDVLTGQKLELLGVKANLESLTLIPGPLGSVIGLVGLDADLAPEDKLRQLGGVIARGCKGFSEVVVALPDLDANAVLNLIEGFSLGLYEYNSYKSDASKTVVKKLTVVSSAKVTAAALTEIELTCQAVHVARDLVNQPANDLYPASFEAHAKKSVKGLPLSIETWDEKALAKAGFGGIVAVGAGSSRPPRLLKITYAPRGAKKHLALVGKGITFDTGGLSLKPAESMVGMKYDMTGAATVLQSIIAVAQLGVKTRVTGWICLAENMPSGTATRPNDVIKARNGKTIEVLNTDAEGRLVLADGLSAASEEHPDLIVDIATLTGAATIALGNRTAGLMGDEEAVDLVKGAASETAEPVWHMPLPQELRPLLNSDIADIANVKIGNRAGGMLIGGLFLREFVGFEKRNPSKRISWAHLDIAGPSDNSSGPYGFTPKGATGTMVRTMVVLIKRLASKV